MQKYTKYTKKASTVLYCENNFFKTNWPWPCFSAGTLPQNDIPRICQWSNLDFFERIWYFFSMLLSIYIKIKTQVLKKYNIAPKKSKFNGRQQFRHLVWCFAVKICKTLKMLTSCQTKICIIDGHKERQVCYFCLYMWLFGSYSLRTYSDLLKHWFVYVSYMYMFHMSRHDFSLPKTVYLKIILVKLIHSSISLKVS